MFNKLMPIFIGIFILNCMLSCQNSGEIKQENKKNQTITKRLMYLSWLPGKWKLIKPAGEDKQYEIWNKDSDTSFAGKSIYIKENDTTVFETISIILKDSELYYIPTVADQNQGKPVYFKLSGIVNEEYLFSNKEHDFPQNIKYRMVHPDTMIASVEGLLKGKDQKNEFVFVKEK